VSSTNRYFIINKPYGMVSQFVSPHNVGLLGDLPFIFPEGTHAVGRLDSNSEGLLLLTTNKKVTRLLFSSDQPHKRTYLVQVNNSLSNDNVEQLRTGVSIRIGPENYYTTPPCEVTVVDNVEQVYPFAMSQPTWGDNTWLLITLTEGKFRQVRKMIMAVNHRCKRLIRVSIEHITLENLPPGGIREIDEITFFEKLNIEYQQ
jgi:23S rRNA pseudouridine2457 synthase